MPGGLCDLVWEYLKISKVELENVSLISSLDGWTVKNSPAIKITIFSSWIDILPP